MGCLSSKPGYIAQAAGGEREFQERYLESKILGQGEFGVVKLVHDVTDKDLINSKPLAAKYLKKGYQFKDNTLYTPLKPHVLRNEVEILRRLNGEQYNLRLLNVFETSSQIIMVTDCCEGGEMMHFVANTVKSSGGLRTEDVSRMSFQLFSAVNHCAKHRVIHRDIKPENVMFCTDQKDSELRLIDFGSGTIDGLEDATSSVELDEHHTFAGSAFYISPEMFQKTYTSETDVWSAAAALYVLVAGYPADRLQETFNVLQSNCTKPSPDGRPGGRLRKLPNLPENLPDSFYEMLEGGLIFRHKNRKSAGDLMDSEFAKFHMTHAASNVGTASNTQQISFTEIAAEAASGENVETQAGGDFSTTRSVVIEGSVSRHTMYIGYQRYERSLTTILSTILDKEQCQMLLDKLNKRAQIESDDVVDEENEENEEKKSSDIGGSRARRLKVVPIAVLKQILISFDTTEAKEASRLILSLEKTGNKYDSFAYHISLLRQFLTLRRKGKSKKKDNLDDSTSSSMNSSALHVSVHGSNAWDSWKKQRKPAGLDDSFSGKGRNVFSKAGSEHGGMRRISSAGGALNRMG